MVKLKIADFYYGAVISFLLNNHITPSLIESGKDRRIYNFTTNSMDFRLVVKYRAEKTEVKNDEYSSWTFQLLKEYEYMNQALDDRTIALFCLVCGDENLKNSELVVLTLEDMTKLKKQKKGSVTISRKGKEKYYRIAMGGGRENSLKIPGNRLEKILGTV